jgi:hypothetical protein
MLVLILAMVGTAAIGCGGSTKPVLGKNGTLPGTYTLTVTAATSSNLTHEQQLTLTVQ